MGVNADLTLRLLTQRHTNWPKPRFTRPIVYVAVSSVLQRRGNPKPRNPVDLTRSTNRSVTKTCPVRYCGILKITACASASIKKAYFAIRMTSGMSSNLDTSELDSSKTSITLVTLKKNNCSPSQVVGSISPLPSSRSPRASMALQAENRQT